MSEHELTATILNAHSWYHIDSPLDYIRAAIWCGSNLVTAISYFLIPMELGHWRRVMPFESSARIGQLFIGFIFFCGLSHLAMLVIMQTGPWWATLFIYLPMAVVSAATVVLIRRDRKLILDVLEAVAQGLRGGSG
ncbi:MAG: hypothetical protein ISS15_16600 [Alphaproteobacteria bacterium]|nr:hypothetical protein [Alphaproteobacteria bacterium]MBL6937895.1 hypothetical protein [Alphaproteobacteria bacterium]MBL7099280.1 hypothetical protein [Alphaproteobacteria bacterium]